MTETISPPEVLLTQNAHVACDGPGGASAHPRVFIQIGDTGFADCGYCDRRFVLAGGPADTRSAEAA